MTQKTLADYIKNLEASEHHECPYCKARQCNCEAECSANYDDTFVGCPCVIVGPEDNK